MRARANGALERHRPPTLVVGGGATTGTLTGATTTTTTTRARAFERDEEAETTRDDARVHAARGAGARGDASARTRRARLEESIVSREARDDDADDAAAKSAARVRVERALGGAFDYRQVVARALASAEEEMKEKKETRATNGDEEAWRGFPNEETRAFAIDARRDVERRMRDIRDEIAEEIWGETQRERRRVVAHESEREEKTRAPPMRNRVGVRKTAVAFGTTVRA